VQSDARRLIAQLEGVPPERRPASVHVSGCGKGCARAEPAELSFVAVDPGAYEMYRGDARGHEDHPRFGERISGRVSWADAIDVVTGGVGDEH
jgi:sulfite reductase beta subunit-like hemoprotein